VQFFQADWLWIGKFAVLAPLGDLSQALLHNVLRAVLIDKSFLFPAMARPFHPKLVAFVQDIHRRLSDYIAGQLNPAQPRNRRFRQPGLPTILSSARSGAWSRSAVHLPRQQPTLIANAWLNQTWNCSGLFGLHNELYIQSTGLAIRIV
jgi:hypothetical protein